MEISNNAANYASYYNHYQKSTIQTKQQSSTSKTGTSKTKSNGQPNTDMTYTELIHNKVEELYEKIKTGDTEKSYPIGSESYTEKEWDNLMEQIDRIEEQIREMARREQERLEEKRQQKELQEEKQEREDLVEALLAESTTSYEIEPVTNECILKVTWYTKDGIYCRKEGQEEGYLWTIPFTEAEQYEKVIAHLNQFNNLDDMEFAGQENFWRRFLNMQEVS